MRVREKPASAFQDQKTLGDGSGLPQLRFFHRKLAASFHPECSLSRSLPVLLSSIAPRPRPKSNAHFATIKMDVHTKQQQYNGPPSAMHHPAPHLAPRFFSVPPSSLYGHGDNTPGLTPTHYTHQHPHNLSSHALKPSPIATSHVSYGQAYSTHAPPSPPAGTISMSAAQPQQYQHAGAGGPRSAPPSVVQSRETFRTPSPTPFAVQQQHNSPQRKMPTARSPVMLPPHLQLPSNSPEVAPENMRCTDFVAKLWFLLDRPAEYSRHIRWTPSGSSFIFYPTSEFANEVLARLFKHSNVASFVRQLNLYGFQRISHLELLEDLQENPDEASSAQAHSQVYQDAESPSMPASGFHHPDFQRNSPTTLGKIRPKPSPNRKRNNTGGGGASKKRARSRTYLDEDEAGYELEDLPQYQYQPDPKRRRG